MKKLFKYIAITLLIASLGNACSTDPEAEIVVKPNENNAQYYKDLRAYKNSDHEVFFGWFGYWSASGPSMSNYLRGLPDSVDIVSIWGEFSNLSEEKIEDMRYVQEVWGTKVTFTIFAHGVPEPFTADTKGVQEYAKALNDTINKYGYDGIDLDYEPGFGGVGPLVGHDNLLMKDFVLALSKYVGPKSGTNKLFIIDGVPFAVHTEIAECFDYGVVQSYRSRGYTDLQSRFDRAAKKGWKPEQYIFAETFEEGYHATGGVDHTLREGGVVPSLEGMARFKPMYNGELATRKGGCGTFHMEYDYRNADAYKYTLNAIRIMSGKIE